MPRKLVSHPTAASWVAGKTKAETLCPQAIWKTLCSGQSIHTDVKVAPRFWCLKGERYYQCTALDVYSHLFYLGTYEDQSIYSSTDFLKSAVSYFKKQDSSVASVQTGNGFEFTNRFSKTNRNLISLFERIAAYLKIRHKLIRPCIPCHNGKEERSHREDKNASATPTSSTSIT